MLINIVLLIVGVALILWGADKLTDGACGLARRFHVSELVIGLTVVAFGTSLPEFIVSFLSALKGVGGMSAGNIVGSNIFNTLVIVGATAAICPIAVSRGTVWRDMPYSLLAALAFWFLCADGDMSRGDGLIFLCFFVIFMCYTMAIARHRADEEEEGQEQEMPVWKILLLLVAGGGCLIGGGQLLVNSASAMALAMGVSEAVVGLTIVAAGTSLPELATSIAAARKGSSDMAIGNALGSNIFNVFFVLGACATITPMQASGITLVDLAVLTASGVIIWLFARSRYRIGRIEGGLMVTLYIAYLTYLVMQVTS